MDAKEEKCPAHDNGARVPAQCLGSGLPVSLTRLLPSPGPLVGPHIKSSTQVPFQDAYVLREMTLGTVFELHKKGPR